jgi:queuine/archaeosine tRNA-ribosyltransferase
MPVGTQATVKTLDQQDLKNINAPIVLGNTYHLHLRPGEDVVAAAGGLHKFMNWSQPILTDSGGFQVFSLGLQKNKGKSVILSETKDPSRSDKRDSSAKPQNDNDKQGQLVSIDEDGVTFTSHLDGSTHRFTPESAIEIQHKLGADIIMAFDECTPDNIDYQYAKEAMERTHRWAERCLAFHKNKKTQKQENNSTDGIRKSGLSGNLNYSQFLFGIIQGSNHEDLRKESAKFISSLDFDGIAIGGESIGYNMEATKKILDWVYPIIPENKPRYAMGIGLSPTDLLTAVEHGVDMFDCVAPTRLARHGILYCHPEGAQATVGIPRPECWVS